jgi:hypothetical protein
MKRDGKRVKPTYITHHMPIHSNELRELPIALVYFPRPPPQTRWDAHRREDTVVIEEHPLKLFLDKYQINILKRLRDSLNPIVSTKKKKRPSVGMKPLTLNFGRNTESGWRICCFDSWDTFLSIHRDSRAYPLT